MLHRKLPPPASVQVYALTPWGLEADRPPMELGRWAVRSPAHDPTLPLSAASLMMSFRTMYAGGEAMTVGFGAETFVARLDEQGIAIRRDAADLAKVTFDSDPLTIASIVYGARPIADAERAGVLRLAGDRAVADRFITCFPLPATIDAVR